MIPAITSMKNAFDLTGKNAVITGGNRGLGLGIALAMAQSGANVAILCRDSKKAAEALEQLKEYGGKYAAFDCDVTDLKSVRAAAETVSAQFGETDILVNNAGVSCVNELLDMDEELTDWYNVVNTDLNGTVHMTYEFGKKMRDAKNAEIKCAGVQGVLCEFAAELANRFENTYQGISVYLREYKDCICDDVVENEEVELGFGMEPLDEKKFECHRLLRFKLVCLMHESHPWAKYDKIPLSVLPTENFIMVDEQFKTADSFIKKCAEKGVEIHPKLRVGEITAVHRLVREHNGVGLTNQSVADALATPDTVWREFDSDDMYWAIDIFKKKSVKLSKSAQIFWEYVQRKMSMDEREKIAPAVIMEQHFT
ncbi:MAG: SDR family NAD(P)-dependent oxidoreductase [Oscillospiraceae bacterium]|nr:SDR family NAD(P)-dependent oxidoreductase [Oscillospiraceae bacterium]